MRVAGASLRVPVAELNDTEVARYVADRWGVRVRPETGWRWLRKLGFTLQVPRPRHPRAADVWAQRRWKKTCAGA